MVTGFDQLSSENTRDLLFMAQCMLNMNLSFTDLNPFGALENCSEQ